MLVVVPDDHHIRAFVDTAYVYTDALEPLARLDVEQDLFCHEVEGRSAFRPFGICSDETYIYIASHRRVAKYNKETLKYAGLLDVELFPNTHQLHCKNNVIYAASTAVNAISFITEQGVRHYSVVQREFVEVDDTNSSEGDDISHVNSVYATDTHLYYCLHNWGKKLAEVRKIELSSMEDTHLFRYGLENHGVLPVAGKVISLSSGTGEVIIFDESTKQITAIDLGIDPKTTFLRGLDEKDGKVFFAASNHFAATQDPYRCVVYKLNLETNTVEDTANLFDMFTVADMRFV